MITVGDLDAGQIGGLQGLPPQELDAVLEAFLDEDVVLVAIGNGQGHHLLLLAQRALVERQVLHQISLGHLTPGVSDVLGQLDVGAVPGQQPVKGLATFLRQLDRRLQLFQGDLRGLVDEGVGPGQFQHLEVTVFQLGLTHYLVFRQLGRQLLTAEAIADPVQRHLFR